MAKILCAGPTIIRIEKKGGVVGSFPLTTFTVFFETHLVFF